MRYRSMLVHADLSRHAPERFRFAVQLARAHDAHLIAVAATGVSRAVFPHGYHAAPDSLEASCFGPLRDNAAQALERFDIVAREAGVSHESRLVWDLAGDALARIARCADLVVVSQDDPDEALGATLERLPEYVALTSACALLVLPRVRAPQPDQHVLVAWNGSKESSSALRGAMALLQRAARVSVVAWRAPGARDDILDAVCQTDLAAYLARHDVCAEIRAVDADIEYGHALLAMAAEHACDLIVCGCYGHSGFRELFLGGVTRTLLQEATVPVLMAR